VSAMVPSKSKTSERYFIDDATICSVWENAK
jgi:hypothetical protein